MCIKGSVYKIAISVIMFLVLLIDLSLPQLYIVNMKLGPMEYIEAEYFEFFNM